MNAKAILVLSPMQWSQQVKSKSMAMNIAIPMRDLLHGPADLEVTVDTPKWPLLQTIQQTQESYQKVPRSILVSQICLYLKNGFLDQTRGNLFNTNKL